MIFLNTDATGNADWFIMKPPALNTSRIYSAFLNTQNILDFIAYTKSQEAVRKFYKILTMVYHIWKSVLGEFHSPFRVKYNKTIKVHIPE